MAARVDDDERPAVWRLAQKIIEAEQLERASNVVFDFMAGVPERRDQVTGNVTRITSALTQPWTPPALAEELRDGLAAPTAKTKGDRWAGLMPQIGEWLDLDVAASAKATDDSPGLAALEQQWSVVSDSAVVGEELLTALSEFMGLAHEEAANALSGFSDEQRALLFDTPLTFREAYYRDHFPDSSPTAEQQTLIERLRDEVLTQPGQDRARLLAVTDVLLRLTEDGFVSGLTKRFKGYKPSKGSARPPAGFKKDIVAVVGESDGSRVVLGGRKTSVYSGPAALIIDLGGNDDYARAAVVDSPNMLASVVLDLSGNDSYEGDGLGPATATGGVALLLDVAGKDKYTSQRLGQAASTLGVALLIDVDGNDTYVMEDYGQGHALGGVALLYDLQGDDSYNAWAYAQGGGLGPGLAALIDGTGDDTYLADLAWPDVYGNSGPDIFHGASQGYSTGMRPELAGGYGVLLDLDDGDDRYQSGNFSQGGAYYFAFGLMYDDGGDDENLGCRYSQGFGVHQAAAVRWDRSGDDTYTCRSVAHAGMAWDEGVGYFFDDEGNDTYRLGDLALGGAAQTGVAIFVDGDGKDQYQSGKEGQGGTGASEYHDKPAFALMVDLGGDKDSYSEPGRKDGERIATTGVAIFLDTKAKTLEKAIAAIK